MKKILITGANSYIGTSFEGYLRQWPKEYQVDTIDMIDDAWRKKNFFGYDSVFHVAGIAHIKETKENEQLYYKINRDLAIDTAKKAAAEGLMQFVYLSSMSVYGMETGIITRSTIPSPKSNYGKSKLQAEEELLKLKDQLAIAIIRPPMVYGKGCKGKYATLTQLAKKLPVFPEYENQRSMVEINKMCEYVKNVIDEEKSGFFFPQDANYACTSVLVRKIAEENNNKIFFTKVFNPIIRHMKFKIINKAFGSLIYKDME